MTVTLRYKKGPDGTPDRETIALATSQLSESLDRAFRLGIITEEQLREIKNRPPAKDVGPASEGLDLLLPRTSNLTFDELSAPLIRLHDLDYVTGLVEHGRISTETARTIIGKFGPNSIHLEFASVNRLRADIEQVDQVIAGAKSAGLTDDSTVREYSDFGFEAQWNALDQFKAYLKTKGIQLNGA